MTGFTRAARATNFSLMEAAPAIVLLVVLCLGGDWADEAADESGAEEALRGRALSIAMERTSAVAGLGFDDLQPTDGFTAVPAGLLGMDQVDHATSENATGPDAAGYDIEMRITNLDTAGQLRRIEIRVGYDHGSGERTWVGMATVRQDRTTLQARAQRTADAALRSAHS